MIDNVSKLIQKGEIMVGRKKKSKEKKPSFIKEEKPLFTKQEQDKMLLDLIGSMVNDKDITGFIIIAESDKQDHIAVCNMNHVKCLGFAEKLSLCMRNKLLTQMVKANENDKPKKRRNKKTSNH